MALALAGLKPAVGSREELTPIFDRIVAAVRQDGGEVIEIQVGAELTPIYMVAEHADPTGLSAALSASVEAVHAVAEVRLVGAMLDQVKASRGAADYLVEWDRRSVSCALMSARTWPSASASTTSPTRTPSAAHAPSWRRLSTR